MGVLPEPEWMKLPEVDLEAVNDIPDDFDARTQWPDCESVQEVRD